MKKKVKIEKVPTLTVKLLLVLGILLYFIGFLVVYAKFFDIKILFSFFGNQIIDSLVLVVGVFVLSMLFFSYFGPVAMLLVGIWHGNIFDGNFLVLIKVIPLLVANYGGMLLGFYLKEDLYKRTNVLRHWKIFVGIFVVSLILAVAIDGILMVA